MMCDVFSGIALWARINGILHDSKANFSFIFNPRKLEKPAGGF